MMMKKIAVLLAPGFEEIEALAPVDIFRRAGFQCDLIGLHDRQVVGSHAIAVIADQVFDGNLQGYNAVVLPGGMPGSLHLRDHQQLITCLQEIAETPCLIAAICAAPLVLDRAGLLERRRYTCFPEKKTEILTGNYQPDLVVLDGTILTSQGAGTSLDFAYAIVDYLGSDGTALAQSMVYDRS